MKCLYLWGKKQTKELLKGTQDLAPERVNSGLLLPARSVWGSAGLSRLPCLGGRVLTVRREPRGCQPSNQHGVCSSSAYANIFSY